MLPERPTRSSAGRPRPVNLRPHHLLCIRAFRGFGYSKDFVKNMAKIVELCADLEQSVRITEGPDDICACCPHKKGQSCTKDTAADAELIYRVDRHASQALGILPGATYQMRQLKKRLEGAWEADALGVVCAECEWYVAHCQEIFGASLNEA